MGLPKKKRRVIEFNGLDYVVFSLGESTFGALISEKNGINFLGVIFFYYL